MTKLINCEGLVALEFAEGNGLTHDVARSMVLDGLKN